MAKIMAVGRLTDHPDGSLGPLVDLQVASDDQATCYFVHCWVPENSYTFCFYQRSFRLNPLIVSDVYCDHKLDQDHVIISNNIDDCRPFFITFVR